MFNIGSSKKSDSYSSSSPPSSSSCYLARTLKTNRGKNLHPATWSMSSVLTTLPESPPPPICSHPLPLPPSHANTYIDNATDFSTPRNQRLSMAYNENDNNSNCFFEIDEWLEHANKFCKSFNHHTDDHFTETRGNGSPDHEQDMRISAVCKNYLKAQEHQLYNIILPSVREESPVLQNITSCINRYEGGSSSQHTKLISRPKPYDEFLNETRKKKLAADKDARNKAKHLQLMQRLRRKEEAINDWEMHETMKAMDDMDKIQACNFIIYMHAS
ncbi:hypothetical protein TSUD_391410 [Trifolium subterraneum]|uniref:Uncharacterized protein n=1 Tax=Trifolium subterraneum TaxID=3900 RepID=A0A2Z6LXV9_TRISU|nr:hypothetical protein TSUD_391410 [Trifolium subterraneum]